MATRKKHLINVHTSTGTTTPTGASLYLGEIAVQHTPNDPGLWIKMGTSESSDEYEKFIGETRITNMLSEARILGSAYTYTGLPQVNSATTLEAAYSALTKEVVDGSLVVASALNDLNGRVIEISGNTPDMTNYYDKGEVEHIISVSGGTDVSPLSGAVVSLSAGTHAHVTNGDIHVTAAQKTAWTNGSNSGASAYTGVTQLSGVVESLEDEVAKIAVTAVTVTGEGNAVTAATYAGSALTLAMGDVDMILGSGYTYSGLPYVTSATSLADAYSALTREMIDDEKVVAEALNDLNLRVKELSGNSGGGTLTGVSAGGTEVPVTDGVAAIPSASSSTFGVVKTGDFLTNTSGTIKVATGTTSSTVARGDHAHSGYATTTDLNALSAATTAHTADTAVHVTAAQKTNWTNSGTSGANAYVGFIAHSANTQIHVTAAEKGAWNAKASVDDLAGFFDGAVYDSGSRRINFKHGDTVKAWIDADPFIKDGMLSSVTISGGKMIMTFNTEAGHDDIELNLTDIFNADNYYDKTAADGRFVAKEAGKDLMTDAERTKLGNVEAGAEVNVQADWSETATTSDAYIRNKPFIPSKVSDLNNDLNFTSNVGTVTGVRMNGGDKTPTGGVVNLGTVITAETQLSVATAGTGNAVTGITVNGHGITAALGGPFATTGAVSDVASDLAAHTADTQVHVTAAQKAAWDAKKSNVRADWSETATTSDAYILNKPSIPDAPGTLTTTATTPLASAVTESLTGNVSLHKIAKTGSYNDLNNKPTIPTVPANISAFNNDAGYITGYTESDPTVPAWAKAATKPAYTASEVGALPAGTTLDGVPDGATRKLANYSLTSHTHSNYATTTSLNALSGGTVSRINSLSGAAVNNQNRINSLSGAAVSNKTRIEELSGAMMSKEYVISQAFNNVNDRILELSGSTGLPDVTAADNGKILRVQSGAWAMVDPTVIYTGNGAPASTLGNEGDIYFQV